MRKLLKQLYYKSTIGNFIIAPVKKLYNYYLPRLLPENIYIKLKFKTSFGYNLNLKDPKTFNEKIHWLQQNDRIPLKTLCSDKYTVRKYVKRIIGEKYLIPLVYQTTKPSHLIPENLPDYPFIIKTNHGCGSHIIIKDKSQINWKTVQKKLNKLLKRNFYYKGREWQYKNIKPRIVVEKLLLDRNLNIPYDFKIHCFNGRATYIGVIFDKDTNTKINYYDFNWNMLDLQTVDEKGIGVSKPKVLNKIKSIAEALAKNFRYVRVDLYIVENKIYFGELTFSPAAGFAPFNPPEWDIIFGDKLDIE